MFQSFAMRTWLGVVMLLLVVVAAEAHGDHMYSEKAQKFHQKWGIESVMRDTDHILEDMKSMIELREIGEISHEQMIFYLVRMHDFDDNGGLDGLELWTTFAHSMAHFEEFDYHNQTKIEVMVDEVLSYDDSGDGFVDYGEFRKHTS